MRYVVVGGFAAVAHGSPRLTSDVDVTPARDLDNLMRLSDALRDLDARIRVGGMDQGVKDRHAVPIQRALRDRLAPGEP